MELEFKKDVQGWFIDLKKSPFTRGQLAMVAGADTLLDLLSFGESKIKLELSHLPFFGATELTRENYSMFGGGYYVCKEANNHKLWLCPVTLYVFKKYPKKIYFKKIKI